MTCPHCGAAVSAGTSACGNCGAPVTDPVAKTLAIATEDVAERDALLAQLKHELAGEYEVERELGRGGMGVVFKATEIELGRPVALKVLPPTLGQGAAAERFRREARLAAALDHPGIIPIYRVGKAAGTYYFAMKLVEGRALDEIIQAQGALPLPVILAILRTTTSALAFAHDRQIIHRDIKGANILVDRDGRVMISDFGIARAGQEKTLTAAGAMMGTPYYMSPEQGWGGMVGPQSDQYALGVLTFQMVTGQVPFDADSLMTILQHHYFTPPPDVRTVRDGVPPALVHVMEKALRKNSAERYASTRDMLAEVEAIPSSEAERAQAQEMLRQLARGGTVDKVRTGSLPPLDNSHFIKPTDTVGLGGRPVRVTPPPGMLPVEPPPPRPARWWERAATRRAAIGVAALAGLSLVWWLGRPRPEKLQPVVTAPSPAAETVRTAAPPRTPRRETVRRAGGGTPTGAATRSAAKSEPAVEQPAATQSAPPPVTQSPLLGTSPLAGTLRVYTVPVTATIMVDGQVAGAGVLPGVAVVAGRRHLRISAPGYVSFDTTVTVSAGRLTDLRGITLKRQPG